MKRYLLSLLLLFGFGCSNQSPKKPTVLVCVSPYQTIVKEIVGSTANVYPVVPIGFNAHIFEPSPKDALKLEEASLLFGVGDLFETKVSRIIKQKNPSFIYVNMAESMPYLIHEDHIHEEDHDHFHAQGYDVHIWMDPLFMTYQVDVMVKYLCQLFPQNKALYEKNGEILKHRLLDLDHEIAQKLKPYAGNSLLLSHPALGYFCKRYSLNQITLEVEGKELLPKELEQVLKRVQSSKVRCIFTQPGVNNKGAISIGEKLRIPIYTIDPNNPDYENTLKKIASDIAGSS